MAGRVVGEEVEKRTFQVAMGRILRFAQGNLKGTGVICIFKSLVWLLGREKGLRDKHENKSREEAVQPGER